MLCRRFGGALPAGRLEEVIVCAHCGYRQAIDPAALAELRVYEADVARDRSAAATDRARARQRGARARTSQGVMAVVLLLVAPLLVGTLATAVGVPWLGVVAGVRDR